MALKIFRRLGWKVRIFLLFAVAHIINPNIDRERNQTAVENVVIIVTTIEQAGNHPQFLNFNIKVNVIAIKILKHSILSQRIVLSKLPRGVISFFLEVKRGAASDPQFFS